MLLKLISDHVTEAINTIKQMHKLLFVAYTTPAGQAGVPGGDAGVCG